MVILEIYLHYQLYVMSDDHLCNAHNSVSMIEKFMSMVNRISVL